MSISLVQTKNHILPGNIHLSRLCRVDHFHVVCFVLRWDFVWSAKMRWEFRDYYNQPNNLCEAFGIVLHAVPYSIWILYILVHNTHIYAAQIICKMYARHANKNALDNQRRRLRRFNRMRATHTLCTDRSLVRYCSSFLVALPCDRSSHPVFRWKYATSRVWFAPGLFVESKEQRRGTVVCLRWSLFLSRSFKCFIVVLAESISWCMFLKVMAHGCNDHDHHHHHHLCCAHAERESSKSMVLHRNGNFVLSFRCSMVEAPALTIWT